MTLARVIPDDLTTRAATETDLRAIEALHAMRFGPGRFTRTAYRLREGVAKVSPFCRVAESGGCIVGAIRFTSIATGGVPGALLLGPLAVTTELANIGIGVRLVREGLEAARETGIRYVLLVGDMPYYARFGFEPVPPGRLVMPGPVDPARLLACQLLPESADARQGAVRADR
jgi:predicted N-acetyltransferase YhbS